MLKDIHTLGFRPNKYNNSAEAILSINFKEKIFKEVMAILFFKFKMKLVLEDQDEKKNKNTGQKSLWTQYHLVVVASWSGTIWVDYT